MTLFVPPGGWPRSFTRVVIVIMKKSSGVTVPNSITTVFASLSIVTTCPVYGSMATLIMSKKTGS